MSKKESKKPERKPIVHRVVAAAKNAKKSAKAVLVTGRTMTRPVEIEPRAHADVELTRALKRERQRLLEELKKQQVLSQDHPTTGNHMADDATDVAEQAKTLALRTHLEGMLKEVDRALVRIDKGTYGLCERCGKPIGEERLKVMPWATLCIEHAKSAQALRLKATAA